MTLQRAPRICVIGWPIKHSRSPLIHNRWLKQYGLDGSYEKHEVRPEHLATFIQSLREGSFAGCNVTIPHKENIGELVDEIDPVTKPAGSSNTLHMEAGILKATSTDGEGFYQNLMAHQPGHNIAKLPIVILGAGGSARAIAHGLVLKGASRIFIHNRNPDRAKALAHMLGKPLVAITSDQLPDTLQQAGTLINTTSAGLTDNDNLQIPWHHLHPQAVVADIVYTPLVTAFLEAARRHGHPVVPGLGMLLHQAVVGFEKWFGVRPEVTQELYDLVARDIDPDFKP